MLSWDGYVMIFHAVLALLQGLTIYVVNDLRSRIMRLEELEMKRK